MRFQRKQCQVGGKSNRSRRYTEEFQRDAVALVRSSGKTANWPAMSASFCSSNFLDLPLPGAARRPAPSDFYKYFTQQTGARARPTDAAKGWRRYRGRRCGTPIRATRQPNVVAVCLPRDPLRRTAAAPLPLVPGQARDRS